MRGLFCLLLLAQLPRCPLGGLILQPCSDPSALWQLQLQPRLQTPSAAASWQLVSVATGQCVLDATPSYVLGACVGAAASLWKLSDFAGPTLRNNLTGEYVNV